MKLWTKVQGEADSDDRLPTQAELRQRNRELQQQIAAEAAERRAKRGAESADLVRRVEEAKRKLGGQNVAQAVQTIELASPAERNHYLLAEKYGAARIGVLRSFGPPSRSSENAYIQAAGLETPNESPETGTD